MTRLIDADKLKAHYSWWKDGTREMTMGEAKDIFDEIVDLQPTVDAESLITRHEDIGYERGYRDGYAEALEVTDNVEPVKHGHWEWDDELGANVCSSCGRPTYDSHDECVEFMGSKVLALVSPHYCGFCGAKMDEAEEE